MKTLSKNLFTFLLAITTLFSSNAFANTTDDKDGIDSKVVTTSDKFTYSLYAVKESLKFRLNFETESTAPTTVKIYNAQGTLTFTETIRNQTSSHRNYDLTQTGKGIYKVEITNGDFTTVREIGVGVNINQGEFSAYISKTLNETSLRLAYQNGDIDGVSIVLRDEKGNIVYDELSTSTQYSRKLNLSKLDKGTYTVSVTSGNKTIEQVYHVQ